MVRVTKWYEDGKPSEKDVISKLEEEGFKTSTWSNDPGTTKDPETSDSDRIICVVDGMVRFTLPDSGEEYIDVMPGDRLELPAGVKHGMMVGPAGVKAVEGAK